MPIYFFIYIFLFKDFGLYILKNEVFLIGCDQGSIIIKVASFDGGLHVIIRVKEIRIPW